MSIYYRFRHSIDPEERLEDAAMGKALFDAFEGKMTMLDVDQVPPDGWLYGARRTTEPQVDLPYWTDPAFLQFAHRKFMVGPIGFANAAVEEIHASGQYAFVKSVRSKHITQTIPLGSTIAQELGARIYDFDEDGPDIMVQEYRTMHYEWRFFAIERRIVADSPNASHLVPFDHPQLRGYRTRYAQHTSWWRNHERLRASLLEVAQEIAKAMTPDHAVIDCAEIGGKAGCVELNPMVPGNVGLFGCDIRMLAGSIAAAHPLLAMPASEALGPLSFEGGDPWSDPVDG